jgi:predicted benzoate:H+ symporter BenE
MQETKDSFRYRIIPATVSWVFGTVILIGIPFMAYSAWNRFPMEFPESQPYRLSCYLAVAAVPCFLLMGLLLIYSGKEWMRGKWLLAIIPYAIAATLMGILERYRELISDMYK